MSRHTAGPWEAVSKEGRIGVDVRAVSGRRVAATYGICNAPRSREAAKHQAEEDRANAIFIAASPELAEALQRVLPYMEAAEKAGLVGDEGCHWPVEFVRAALKKAGLA